MTSRELVRRTLSFEKPSRIPRQKWILPWAESHFPDVVRELERRFPDDLVAAPAAYTMPLNTVGSRYEPGTYIDEWGCVFRNLHDGVIGIVQDPLIAEWTDLERFHPPEATLRVDTEKVNAFCRGTECFVLSGSVVRPFERLQFIRTMEQTFIDLTERPPELLDLLSRIHRHYIEEVEAWARTEVDGISLMDDWGVQDRMMVSPDIFRTLFKPMYREYAEIARKHGKYVFLHSDGYITDIIPDLIEIGVDALNSQIFCMGVETLGESFRGRITFWGEIDRQQILARGDLDSVRSAVQKVFHALHKEGGVIAQCEFGPGARPENVITVFEAWDRINL